MTTKTPDVTDAEVRELLIDDHTVSDAVRLLGVTRHRADRIANEMRAEGLKVMRAVQGRRPK
jgi:hypothetical protein